MNGYVLDTDTLTLIQFGHAVAVRNLSNHADSEVALAVITFQEQMRGWLSRLNQLATPSHVVDWYDRLVIRIFPVWRRFQMLPFPLVAMQRFEQLRSLRLNIGAMDLRLAAIAMEENRTVVTRNVRDFGRIPGLKTEDWSV